MECVIYAGFGLCLRCSTLEGLVDSIDCGAQVPRLEFQLYHTFPG